MITTVLGTCDYCGKENCEVAFVVPPRHCEQFACLECRDRDPELRKADETEKA